MFGQIMFRTWIRTINESIFVFIVIVFVFLISVSSRGACDALSVLRFACLRTIGLQYLDGHCGSREVAVFHRRPGHSRAMPVAAAAPAPQMSPDGAFWWDVLTWREAQHEVPLSAQRSPDGAFWWDGQKWRPVS